MNKINSILKFDWSVFSAYLFGDLKLEFILAFYIFVGMGIILNLSVHLADKAYRKSKTVEGFKFKLKFWIKDNGIRVLSNLIAVFLLLRFYDILNIGYQLNMFLGVIVGSSLDLLIIFIRNKTSINIFQSISPPNVDKK